MGGYAAAVQNDQNLKNQQRAQTAALYWNAVQTELPPSTVKDASGNQVKNPAYDEALQKRENALKSYISYLGPEQHATIGNRIHGLIFGPEHQEMQQNAAPPVSAQAPVPPGTAPTHPFEHNPVYAGILKGLEGLGSHLKAAAHPLPPQPQPDYKTLAEVPTARDLALRDEATKAAQARALEELKNQGALAVAKARGQFSSMSTPQKAFLNRWAVDHGADDFNGLSSDQQMLALKAFKVANAPASHLQLKPENGNLYTFDPATGKMTFKAKLADVRKTQGVRFVTNALTGEVTEVPYTTYTSKESGEPIADDSGAPIGASQADQKPPTSSQAPSLDATNAGIKAGNAASKKLNKGKPVSRNAPRVVAHTASLMDKSDAAQYTKIAEDANNKEEAFKSAQEALKAPTASSDQELIYSWVRSNVQGAGRMTQAEFRQAAATGSLPLRAQSWFEKAKSGRLPPELEQMMFADIKRAYETSRDEADKLRKRLAPGSSQAPQMPASSSTGFDWRSLPQ